LRGNWRILEEERKNVTFSISSRREKKEGRSPSFRPHGGEEGRVIKWKKKRSRLPYYPREERA